MNFCTAGYLRIKSSPNNASWFIQTNFLEAILKIFSTKHWCNGSFQSFYPCRLLTEKKATWMPRGAYLLVWQRVWIIKLLHDSTYDPLKQAKRTFWCFARLTINSVSGCFRRFSGKFLKQTECLERHSWLENSRRKFGFHVFKPFLNIIFMRPFFVKGSWLRQMVNAINERNQNSSVLNSVHHLPKPWSDRFTHVILNSKKSLVSKSLRYSFLLSLSAARDISSKSGGRRVYRRICAILSTLRGLVKCIADRS